MATKIKIGDKVKYTARFLQSVGGATGWPRKGIVVGFSSENPTWANVAWDGEEPRLVSVGVIMVSGKPDTTGL